MKSFFKTLAASFLALILFFGTLIGLLILLFIALISLNVHTPTPKIQSDSFLVYDLATRVMDTPRVPQKGQPISNLFLNARGGEVSLRQLLSSLRMAETDKRISGIILQGASVAGTDSGYATLKEVRDALVHFKENSKKPIFAYLVSPSIRDYYLSNVANHIFQNPFGELLLPGFNTEPMFFGNALKKYGIGIQVAREGKYKSFVEPFLYNQMSEPNREQLQTLLNDLWNVFLASVQEFRQITPENFQALMDSKGIIEPEVALQNHLITKVGYLNEVIDALRRRTGRDSEDKTTFKQVNLINYVDACSKNFDTIPYDLTSSGYHKTLLSSTNVGGKRIDRKGPKVAIVYAEGDIVDGEGEFGTSIGGDRFARALRHIRFDDTVKAIVLRVNSPGGSALASEIIQRELVLCREAGKPVIVSMGSLAASGGYWIATASDYIFAEPNTITGSIGVFGILPNFQKLANDFGVSFDLVKTGKFADFMTVARPKSPEEIAIVQRTIDRIYDRFLDKVSTARGLPKDRVQEIAQGRVWSGTEAVKLGLVSALGGLEKALEYANKKVGLTDPAIIEFPEATTLADDLSELFRTDSVPLATIPSRIKNWIGISANAHNPLSVPAQQIEQDLKAIQRLNDPMHAYARMPFDLNLN